MSTVNDVTDSTLLFALSAEIRKRRFQRKNKWEGPLERERESGGEEEAQIAKSSLNQGGPDTLNKCLLTRKRKTKTNIFERTNNNMKITHHER